MLNLKWFSADGEAAPRFDISLEEDDQALETAIILSLFLDRHVTEEEVDAGADLRGFWADALEDGEQTGSRLWLLAREKTTPEVVRDARDYAKQALEWMLDDGLAARIEVQAQRAGTYTLDLTVTIDQPEGGQYQKTWHNLTFK